MKSLHIPAIVLLISIAVCVLSFPSSSFKKEDQKVPIKRGHVRDLYQFGTMISCATNRSGWDYYDYGCWCGYGGSGTPVDETDRCCYTHDSCYDYLVNNNICSSWWAPYVANYLYTTCHKCEPESAYPPDDNDAACKKALSRNLHQFGNMVNCMTNRSRFDYSDYGCWCGMGGSGETVDEVDKCCKIHDKCFVSLMYTKCYFPFHVYTVVYNYQGCRQCDPISSYSSWEDKVDVECKKGVCDCDSAAALCFSQAVYNSSYVNYDTSKC
ncbi:Phospholipase A2 [Desmophyllum pertusum]|uniref:Phospholipase A2 n=1 Tax=Desmophyllum pertusum TaxID=174260 RepID=A0A9W9YIE8_9CNID|nr:Phospholipase A2 [Desmophyllum pertusum]